MEQNKSKRHVISLLVDNQTGVLARVSSLFCRKGFNIDSLTVSATNDPAVSRITVTLQGDDQVLNQLILLTERLEVAQQIFELSTDSVQRELLLLKLLCNDTNRSKILEIVHVFKAKIIDLSPDSIITELTGKSEKIDAFIDMCADFETLEMCRTGITAMERGDGHPRMQKPKQEVRAVQLLDPHRFAKQ